MTLSSQEELKAQLMATDAEFARLATQHAQYKQQVAALEAKAELSSEEELREHELKKLKLHLKDEMTAILSRHAVPA